VKKDGAKLVTLGVDSRCCWQGIICDQTSKFFVSGGEESMAGHIGINLLKFIKS
jgi:hypothetical protein